MKRFIKMLAVTCVAALALTALAAAGASAATFTASKTGALTASQTTNHVFTTGSGGTVSCKKAHTTGTIISTEATSQHVTVDYNECTAYGFSAIVTDGTYELYANGAVDIENTITVTVGLLGCKLTIDPQKGLKSVEFTHEGAGVPAGKLIQHSKVTGIVSTGEGSCSGGTNGAYHGSSLIEHTTAGETLDYHT